MVIKLSIIRRCDDFNRSLGIGFPRRTVVDFVRMQMFDKIQIGNSRRLLGDGKTRSFNIDIAVVGQRLLRCYLVGIEGLNPWRLFDARLRPRRRNRQDIMYNPRWDRTLASTATLLPVDERMADRGAPYCIVDTRMGCPSGVDLGTFWP
jgi:hypothetical protein